MSSAIDKIMVEYKPLGSRADIRLTANSVRKWCCAPTRDGQMPDDRTIVEFVELCRSNGLNPLTRDCYLIGYDGKNGASWQIIVSIGAYLKRASAHPQYQGHEAGILLDLNGEIDEIEGCIYRNADEIIGGWARVYRADREKPIYQTINRGTYDTQASWWLKDPALMCRKTALAAAVREAFPLTHAGQYTSTELESADTDLLTAELGQ